MQQLILFLLSCIGATFIINISYIFKPVRESANSFNEHLGKLLRCPMCMGFWIGIIFRLWSLQDMNNFHLHDLVSYGFASSFVCYTSYLLLKYFMEKYD